MTTTISPSDARRELIRRLGSSAFNYWFGYVANISLVFWLVSHAFWRAGSGLHVVSFLALAATGLFAWTLAEWLLHRYLYHRWQSFLTEGHALHHASPRAQIGVPWYLTTIVVVIVFRALTLLFRPAPTGVVMGFAWLGYVVYCITHHGSHRWAYRSGWLKTMKRHHLLHHAHPDCNWGFTTPLWDHVFCTHYDRARRKKPPSRSGDVAPPGPPGAPPSSAGPAA